MVIGSSNFTIYGSAHMSLIILVMIITVLLGTVGKCLYAHATGPGQRM